MTKVIYHSADFDGIFCREISRKFLGGNDTEYIGWNFGDPLIKVSEEVQCVYVLDLSPDCLTFEIPSKDPMQRLIWIDHHKTSIEKWPAIIPGYRIDGVAACRLAWQWFDGGHAVPLATKRFLSEKQDFIDRKVLEPLAVRLAGEYDIWDKRDPRAETFQYSLRVVDPVPVQWDGILSTNPCADDAVERWLKRGEDAQNYAGKTDASICNSLTWIMEWEGLRFLCINHARFNSLLFSAKDVPETGHNALLGFRFDGKQWMVSLYHAKHRTDLDLSEIAKKYGGGGHRGACGFTCLKLPFM